MSRDRRTKYHSRPLDLDGLNEFSHSITVLSFCSFNLFNSIKKYCDFPAYCILNLQWKVFSSGYSIALMNIIIDSLCWIPITLSMGFSYFLN